MDSDQSDDQFTRTNNQGEVLELGEGQGFDSEEEDDDESEAPVPRPAQKPAANSKGKGKDNLTAQAVDNQHHDLAVSVNDSEEIDSEEEDDVHAMQMQQKQMQPNMGGGAQKAASEQQQQKQASSQAQPQQEKDDDDDDEKLAPGAYNPLQYANLPVSGEVKELFEYIGRFKPQKIELEAKLKPFIPDFVPAVGEVDAFLKMNKPDGTNEDLGITVLDEPALNSEDKTVLELKYVQSKNVVRTAPMDVDSIECADKKPKEIGRWIQAVQDLHKTRPPPTVNYSKAMPDFDKLMEEWHPEMEEALKQIPFPNAEIDMHVSDYARLILAMCDIPVHKLGNNKSVIESLHVLFTLYVEFRNNQHFKQFQNTQDQGDVGAKF